MTLAEWEDLCPPGMAVFICMPEGGYKVMVPNVPDEADGSYMLPVLYLAALMADENDDLVAELRRRMRLDE